MMDLDCAQYHLLDGVKINELLTSSEKLLQKENLDNMLTDATTLTLVHFKILLVLWQR